MTGNIASPAPNKDKSSYDFSRTVYWFKIAVLTKGPRHWLKPKATAPTAYAVPNSDLCTKYEVDPRRAQYSHANIMLISSKNTQITM